MGLLDSGFSLFACKQSHLGGSRQAHDEGREGGMVATWSSAVTVLMKNPLGNGFYWPVSSYCLKADSGSFISSYPGHLVRTKASPASSF